MVANSFEIPHRPDTAGIRYTLWTEQHDRETADLNPCAQRLYRWLLERAAGGIEQEVNLEEFQYSTISQKREKGYHIKHILRSFTSLLTAGFVIVTQMYTNRVMRLVVRHAGPTKPIQLGQKSSQRNLKAPNRTDKFQLETETIETPDSIQSYSEHTESLFPATEKAGAERGGCDDEELEEIQEVIADAPFMQDGNEQESKQAIKPSDDDKFSAPVARTIVERLRSLGVILTSEVRSLIARTPEAELERNVSALVDCQG